jgi:hypothetical protein
MEEAFQHSTFNIQRSTSNHSQRGHPAPRVLVVRTLAFPSPLGGERARVRGERLATRKAQTVHREPAQEDA